MFVSKNIDKLIVIILCIGMPFHSIFFAVTGLNLLILWRDILLVIALFFVIVSRKGKIYLSTEGILIASTMLVCTVYALLFHSSNVSSGIWINTLRIYIGAFAAYYVGQLFSTDKEFIIKVSTLYVKTAIVVSIWGIFQMFVLGEGFLWDIGFGVSSAVLANGFQRNVGVFSSANLMGIYLVFALLLILYGTVELKLKKAWSYFLVISLILTFSTSAVLGMGCCALYEVMNRLEFKDFCKLHKSAIKKVSVTFFVVLIAICFDNLLFGGKITTLGVERIEELFSALFYLDTTRKTSASIHMADLMNSTEIVKNNFWGVGFSDSTFILLGRVPKNNLTHAVESSLFTILFDFGVLVGIVYFLPFLYPIIKNFKPEKKIRIVSDKIMIALMVLYTFLPLVSSIELRFFAFLFLGLESKKVATNVTGVYKCGGIKNTDI